ncbi:kinase-like protein [Cadophora sp. DSE1049]|nr:kinase-like protein [Cadophora sp. DSE1049]
MTPSPPPALKPNTSNPPAPTSPSIKNTRLRRFLVLAAVKYLKRIVPRHGNLIFLPNNICIKYGPLRHLPEAATLKYIAENTSIPVPKVYCAFSRKGSAYIVMQKIRGQMLGEGWNERSSESQAAILEQLKGMVVELRALKHTESQRVSNVAGGPIWDCRLQGKTMWHGPFKTIHDFHKHLRGGFDADSKHYPDFSDMIALQDIDWGPPVFTHGDLSSLNILVRGDKIVGIIDWETSGWYPGYWEYTTAKQVSPMNYFWEKEIDKFLEPMPIALGMEKTRQKYFNDI